MTKINVVCWFDQESAEAMLTPVIEYLTDVASKDVSIIRFPDRWLPLWRADSGAGVLPVAQTAADLLEIISGFRDAADDFFIVVGSPHALLASLKWRVQTTGDIETTLQVMFLEKIIDTLWTPQFDRIVIYPQPSDNAWLASVDDVPEAWALPQDPAEAANQLVRLIGLSDENVTAPELVGA